MNADNYRPPQAELVQQCSERNVASRLYGVPAILLAAFFGGPFAAGLLIYRNFFRLEHFERANRLAVWFAIAGLLDLFAVWHTPPDTISLLFVLLPELALLLIVSRVLLGQAIREHLIAGGELHSTWAAVPVGVGFKLAIIAFFYAVSEVLS